MIMQVKLQVEFDPPNAWIQDPSAWSHGRIEHCKLDPTIRVIGCNRKLNQASYWKGGGPAPFQKSKVD